MKNPKISVLIPTYNRADLIIDTLDSIVNQSFEDWECIIVDDGSTDNTVNVIAEYKEKDDRIKFFKRPETKTKGANACRNIGLENASGEYIVFFDSDDFMTKDHLQVKFDAIEKYQVDYVITKTKNLDGQKPPKHYYAFDAVDLSLYTYITHKVNWLTLDVIIKKKAIEDLSFNEKLQSGQEYNFYCKLVAKTTHYHFVNKEVSLRRATENSTRKNLDNRYKKKRSKFLKEIETYRELKEEINNPIRKELLENLIEILYSYPNLINGYYSFLKKQTAILLEWNSIWFDIFLLSLKVDKFHYSARNILLKKIKSK